MRHERPQMRLFRQACLAALAFVGSAVVSHAGSEPTLDAGILQGVPTALTALRVSAKRQPAALTAKAAARAGYKPLSEITGGAYPAFSPGIGAVYAKREAMPSGPFLAFDRKGRQVSTIYKFSLDRMVEKENLEARGTRMPPVDHVDAFFGGSHPGVDFPHYSIVFWHVPKKDEARVAK